MLSRSGGVRYCDVCEVIKPDRCHHCSFCNKWARLETLIQRIRTRQTRSDVRELDFKVCLWSAAQDPSSISLVLSLVCAIFIPIFSPLHCHVFVKRGRREEQLTSCRMSLFFYVSAAVFWRWITIVHGMQFAMQVSQTVFQLPLPTAPLLPLSLVPSPPPPLYLPGWTTVLATQTTSFLCYSSSTPCCCVCGLLLLAATTSSELG